jgi:alpha-galactosidase
MYSSNERLPFFNLDTNESRGVLVGLGWTGAWQAEMGRAGGALRARAGLPATRFRLRPGEQVRMPRVLVLLWNGPRLHGHNMLRQLLYRHYVAHLPGKPHEPLVSVNLCFTHHGGGGFLEQATQQNVLSLLKPCRELGVEAFVIDAGWYPCKQWGDIMTTQDFRCDRAKYPRGFRPLAEAFRQAGMAFGLWFPPEALGTFAEAKTRDRFLGIVSGFAERDGITMYRQDAGILPSAREPDRQGVAEMQHIAGLYAMQDQLRSRFPAMVMEGCCGGGRRIDLESLSRFLWHQKSDKWFDTLSDHCGLHGANMFLPGGVINVPTSAIDDFGVWSSFGGQLCLAWHPLDKDFPMQKAKRQVALYKSVRQYLSGDFYPLTECSLDAPWLAYQFHRSDLDQGFILVFKRKPSGGNVFRLAPRGLDPGKQYRLTFAPSGEEVSATGDELAQGREITLSATPAAMLVKYASAGLARP